MTPPETIRDIMIAALPAADRHWKQATTDGKHDGTPLYAAAEAGFDAGYRTAMAENPPSEGLGK